jgi:glucose-1-phosphate cytidylyltransferase
MKTVLLAGGLGSRLSEETIVKPKPMVEIGGMPILLHIMKIYAHHGFREFVVALGYKGEIIKDFFINYHLLNSDVKVNTRSGKVEFIMPVKDDLEVNLIDTGATSMTGGRLRRLQSLLEKEGTFMLTYGDGVANVDIKKLLAFHRAHGKIATVTAVRPPARFGAMSFEGDTVLDFMEKPQTGEGWINGGFFVFEPAIFKYLHDDTTILERDPLEGLCRDGQLMAYRHEGFWQPMDTVRDRDSLNDLWKTGHAPWKCWEDH